jgi:hypothetical protein
MDRVRPLPVEDGCPQHLSTLSENALPRPQSLVCPPLQPSLLRRIAPFLSYHSILWIIVPFLHISLHNELVGDGRRWRRSRDQAVDTRRGVCNTAPI